jgi:hypothetical protein
VGNYAWLVIPLQVRELLYSMLLNKRYIFILPFVIHHSTLAEEILLAYPLPPRALWEVYFYFSPGVTLTVR